MYPFQMGEDSRGFRVEWLGMETEYSSYRLGTHNKESELASDAAAESGERRVGSLPRYGARARAARIYSRCVGLGEAVPWSALRLVLGDPGKTWRHAATGDAESSDELTSG